MESSVVSDFYTAEEVLSIKESIYNFLDNNEAIDIAYQEIQENGRPVHQLLNQPWAGRVLFVAANVIPRNIIDKTNEYVHRWYSPKLFIEGIAFTRYSTKTGEPKLAPHYDTGAATLTVDYQLASNVSWPLVIEDKVFTLTDNSALIFKPSYEVHWRVPQLFNDDQYVDMIFFHYTTEEPEVGIDPEEKEKIERSYQDIFKEEFKKVHGWCYWKGSRD
jgi:hypothetical protein